MPQSFARLACHIVFSTKGRAALITEAIQKGLYAYLGGIARNLKVPLIERGGTANHVHLLVEMARDVSVADVVRDMKANSTRWLRESDPMHGNFAWQSGYAAFAVSHSNVEVVAEYIRHQEEHHRTRTFEEEYVAFLQRHGLSFDDRYMWD
jgi:REP element-mobilizing transposase RayT